MESVQAIPSKSSSGPAPVPATEWTPLRSSAGDHNPWLVAVIIALPVFLEVLDTTIANVTLRSIAGNLGAGVSESTWVITSYLVANAAILPLSGWLSDILGRKTFFIWCVALFTIASFFCGASASLSSLIFWRVVQGLSGGGMVPLAQTMLADSFPPSQRGKAFAIFGMAVIVSPVIGPPLGGWITANYSWSWVFYMNVGFGVMSVLLCGMFLAEPPFLVRQRKDMWTRGLRVDYVGFALVAIGLAFLELTLSKGEQCDWFESNFVRTTAAVTAIALVSMVLWELNRADAVLDVSLFRGRTFLASSLVMFAAGVLIYTSNLIMPMLLQSLHGYTAQTAGMALLPAGAASAVGMVLVGILSQKVQARYLVAAGVLLQILPYWHMSGFTPNLTFWHAAWAIVPSFMSWGLIMIPIMTLSYEGLRPQQTNSATIWINISRNVGGSVGISLVTTWIAWRTQYHHSVLAEQVSVYSPAVQEALGGLESSLGGGAPLPSEQASMLIDGMVNQQAAVMAFNDVFLKLLVLCLGVAVLVFFLPRNRPGAGPAGMH